MAFHCDAGVVEVAFCAAETFLEVCLVVACFLDLGGEGISMYVRLKGGDLGWW